ncbi:Tankyrase [Eumeta japonica]|uniref:Tankyrase n=1 Tax=Eumeta variegata TaxID=151549 RepID=A0A4C1T3M8_EUMVA|nr:Tankyrase [Eumeta japonica]
MELMYMQNKGGLVPLHNACSYGHFEVTKLLIKAGADVNANDLWAFTPLHEAASKSRRKTHLLEAAKAGDLDTVRRIILANPQSVNCRDLDGRHSTPLHFAAGFNRVQVVEFLLEQGAEVHAADKGGWCLCIMPALMVILSMVLIQQKNRDGATPADLVKESDHDVAELLRGNSALLDAAKKGNLARVQRLVTPETINCRDAQGRNSTPLHLAAGYNNYEVAEYLLENGADVNAQDKGGLIPLHNASSYGHLEIAASLIKHKTVVNATDKWVLLLHEAAQKDAPNCVPYWLMEPIPI